MSTTTIHVACLALVALDFLARTWRTQLFLYGLGQRLSFGEVLVQSGIGETASSLTPLRAGGEPARIWTMTGQGVPARVGVVAVGVELVATSVVIVLTAVGLAVTIAADWWAATGPGLMRASARGWPWLALIGGASLVAWLVMRRLRPGLLHAAGEELAAARAHLRDIPAWIYAATVPITLVNIGARVAILPLLALTMDPPPPLAATIVGSFALLYAQALIPMPGGAGAIELAFLGGAVGDLGAAETELLFAWRIYTTVLGTLLGIALAGWRFRTNLVGFVARRLGRAAPGQDSS